MFLDDLLETAFRRGTGVSRRYAQRTTRVREIAEGIEVKSSNFASSGEMAEMMYLGERLADAAFRNLPKNLRQAAADWGAQTPEQQIETLKLLTRHLSSKRWRGMSRKNAQTDAKYGAPESVLPRQYGSWTRGPVQPNCLGMTQMLIGFARTAGAPHLMMNVIVRSDEAREAFVYRQLDEISTLLSTYADQPVARALYRSSQTLAHAAARQLAYVYRTQQAHHALVIQVSDSEWGLVDPYMHKVFRMFDAKKNPEMHRYFTEGVYPDLLAMPDRFAVFGQDKVTQDAQDYHLAKYKKLLRRLLSIEDGTVEQLSSVLRSLNKLLAITKEESLGFVCAANVWLKASHAELLKRSVFTYDEKEVRRAKARLRGNKRELRRAYNRAIRRLWEITVSMMYSSSKHDLHPAIEVVNPTLFLGATTVHHLATSQGKLEPRVMRYVASQFIVRDVLDGFEPFLGDPELFEVLRLRLVSLRTALRGVEPMMVLPEIRAFLKRLEH